MVRTMCGLQLKMKRATYLMLGFNGTIDQLAMTNSVALFWSCVEDGGLLIRTLDFEVERHRKKRSLNGCGRSR